MIRAAFFSAGLWLALCGSGLFFVDELTLTQQISESAPRFVKLVTTATDSGRQALNPPDWMPFTCIGVGGVTMLYAIALPRQ